MSPFNYRRRANRKHPVFYYWCFVLRGTISEASTFLLIYGIRAKTHVCTQVRDRRTASQPLTVIGAGSGTNSDLHPQCDFQSYTHALIPYEYPVSVTADFLPDSPAAVWTKILSLAEAVAPAGSDAGSPNGGAEL